ncbi:hypothetical protein GGQ97_000961 [Sphingomonas kaistensis]|uniref:Uncharacterized protein n=1 Tax=Sphingomonas kaistensis TaxID=298708 RepID=A0A7X6BFS8_9SPHN|nr:hypothetical protein [Sphingomonas kaistensis]NJC05168.1 hypothetical protein [Sphingomonas kaistensis]
MRKQLIEQTALNVAQQVRAVEDSIEAALIELAELQNRMIRARSVAGVGIATGHDALEQIVVSLQGLISARGGMAHCHAALRTAKQQVPGLRTVSFGDGQDCPPLPQVATLKVVA